MSKLEYVCEWCEPSSIPAEHPGICRILWCPKHHAKTWHWPRYPKDATKDTLFGYPIEWVESDREFSEVVLGDLT